MNDALLIYGKRAMRRLTDDELLLATFGFAALAEQHECLDVECDECNDRDFIRGEIAHEWDRRTYKSMPEATKLGMGSPA